MPPSEPKKRTAGPGNRLPMAKKAEIVALLANGSTIREVLLLCEISRNTLSGLMQDEKFKDLLQEAEDTAVNTILQEVTLMVRRGVKELAPRALEVMKESLEDEDARVKLQAAGTVLRGSGMMDGGKDLNIRVGLEGLIGNDSPSTGD